MSATVRALIVYPWQHNSSASFAVLFDDQRNGDIGSPRVAGSTSRSSAFTGPGSCPAFDFLPPPAFRTRSGGTSFPSSSRTALCSVVRLNPVARASVAIPPCPRNRASAAATNRRCRSFRYEFKRACFAPNPESSARTVSYILPARMSSLFLPGYLVWDRLQISFCGFACMLGGTVPLDRGRRPRRPLALTQALDPSR